MQSTPNRKAGAPEFPSAAPLPFALRASAALATGALLWAIVFFSHLPVVVGAACSATLGRVFPLPDGCGLDWAFWPSGFETPKAWVVAGAGILAGLLAVAGGARAILSRRERWSLAAILATALVATLAADRSIAPYLADPAWYAALRNPLPFLPPFGSVAGIPEKYHGLLFWWGVAGLWLSFRTAFTAESRRKTARVALATLAATGVYALAQWLGHDPLAWDTRVELTRVFSTTGNPNYYAGLLLPGAALAFWAFEKRWAKIAVAAALVAILLMTKSLCGLALLACWGAWEAAKWAKTNRRVGVPAIVAVAAVAVVSGGWLAQSYGIVRHAPWACQNGVAAAPVPLRACLGGDWQWVGDAEKWKGFVARFYIGASVWDSVTENPKAFLVGRGPDALKTVFERFRRPELQGDYEDPRYVADSAHDWVLDMWHSFGLLGLLAVAVPAGLAARRVGGHRKTALVLWAAFFLFNVPVSANWALAALVLASGDRRQTK